MSIMQSLPLYVAALSRECKTKVTFGGDTAYCEKSGREWIVNIPVFDMNNDETCAAAFAYALHESGHVRFTDFVNGTKAESKLKFNKQVVAWLSNVFEDVYIERSLSKELKGAFARLNKMRVWLNGQKKFDAEYFEKVKTDKLILDFIYSQSFTECGYTAYQKLRPLQEDELINRIGLNFVLGLKAILVRCRTVASTLECVDLTKDVLVYLTDVMDEQQQQQQQQQSGDGDDSQDDDQNGQGQSQSGDDSQGDDQNGQSQSGDDSQGDDQNGQSQSGDDSQGDDQNGQSQSGDDSQDDDQNGQDQSQSGDDSQDDDQNGQSQSGDDDSQGDSSQSNQLDDSSSKGDSQSNQNSQQESQQQSQEKADAAKDILDGKAEMSDDGDVSKVLAEKLTNQSKTDIKEGKVDKADLTDSSQSNASNISEKTLNRDERYTTMITQSAEKQSVYVRNRMRNIIAAKQLVQVSRKSSGRRLISTAGTRLATGDGRVFQKKQQVKLANTAITVVLDDSGSMQGERGQVAAIATQAIIQALSTVNFVKTSVITFGTDTDNAIYRVKGFDESPRRCVQRLSSHLCSNGCYTPLTLGLWGGLKELSQRQEQRKVMLVITDGEPDNRGTCTNLINRIRKSSDVEVFGIGIGDANHLVEPLFGKKYAVSVSNIDDLSDEIFKLSEQILIK